MSDDPLRMCRKKVSETWVASKRLNIKQRVELYGVIKELQKSLSENVIAGSPFCIFNFITSYTEGFDVEIGIPIFPGMSSGPFETRVIPSMEILSLTHRGPAEDLGSSYRELYGYAADLGMISDEFNREVYTIGIDGEVSEIEVQFVIHPWETLLKTNIEKVKGSDVCRHVVKADRVIPGNETPAERFLRLRDTMDQLAGNTTDDERYEILSRCAHVFPESQIAKLRVLYERVREETGDPLKAVDSVIDFMGSDPGWDDRPRREGKVIYSEKKPRSPAEYEAAGNSEEKARAYCFCPLVRDHLQDGMPDAFCYCGAGWYRQQWEGAIGQQVRIEIIRSLLKGDERCEFAVHLPEEL